MTQGVLMIDSILTQLLIRLSLIISILSERDVSINWIYHDIMSCLYITDTCLVKTGHWAKSFLFV